MTTWRLWLVGSMLCCAALAAAYWTGGRAGRNEVRLAWEQQRAADAAAVARLWQQARENERGLQAAADRIRREKDEEIHRMVAAHDAAVERLRKRTPRPAGYVPAPAEAAGAGPAAGCGADQLYQEDAVAALGIARDADLVRAALNQCHEQYEAAAHTLSRDAPER